MMVGAPVASPGCVITTTVAFGDVALLSQIPRWGAAIAQKKIAWSNIPFTYLWEECGSGPELVDAIPSVVSPGPSPGERLDRIFEMKYPSGPPPFNPFVSVVRDEGGKQPLLLRPLPSSMPITLDEEHEGLFQVAVVYQMYGEPGKDVYEAAKAGDPTPIQPLIDTYLLILGRNPMGAQYEWVANDTGKISSKSPRDWDFIFWVVWDSVAGDFKVARIYSKEMKAAAEDPELMELLPKAYKQYTVPQWW